MLPLLFLSGNLDVIKDASNLFHLITLIVSERNLCELLSMGRTVVVSLRPQEVLVTRFVRSLSSQPFLGYGSRGPRLCALHTSRSGRDVFLFQEGCDCSSAYIRRKSLSVIACCLVSRCSGQKDTCRRGCVTQDGSPSVKYGEGCACASNFILFSIPSIVMCKYKVYRRLELHANVL